MRAVGTLFFCREIGCWTVSLLLLLGSVRELQAQQMAVVSGVIKDSSTDKPIPLVNVILLGTRYGAATDSSGSFEIRNLPPDTYVIELRHISYKTKFRTLRLEAGEKVVLTIKLELRSIPLREVVMIDSLKRESLIHRYPGSTIITRQMIDESEATSLAEVVRLLVPRLHLSTIRGLGGKKDAAIMLLVDDQRIPVDLDDFLAGKEWIDRYVELKEIEYMVVHRGANAWTRAGRRGQSLDWLIEIARRKYIDE